MMTLPGLWAERLDANQDAFAEPLERHLAELAKGLPVGLRVTVGHWTSSYP